MKRRGRPPTISAETILSVREALARGESAASVARAHKISRRHTRDIIAGKRRPEDGIELPQLLADAPGKHGRDLRWLFCALKVAGIKLARKQSTDGGALCGITTKIGDGSTS
jgi:hypothetical protein